MTNDQYVEHLDRPREECGVFGIYAPGEDVSRLTYFGLFGLQHRGQESAGIATTDGEKLRLFKDMGLVTQVFDEEILHELTGHIAIGHNRYSTTGSSTLRNAQPVFCESPYGPIAVAHNGNLLNTSELRAEMEDDGEIFESTSDTEVMARLISRSREDTIEKAVQEMTKKAIGSFSIVVLTLDKLVGARDPHGIRPLCLGSLNGGHFVLSSETCALNLVGAKFMREIEPGEMIVIDEYGIHEYQAVPTIGNALCVFEFIYFARPDSIMFGKTLHMARQRMGHELAAEHPTPDAHIIIPIPDTGTPAAIGYAQASRVPYSEGVIRNRYVQRTFIQPDQRMRDLGVRMKFTPLKESLAGKRVVMVEDSIVRGTTTRPIIKLLRDAGAREVHVRISSPPIKYPCFYGIDMAQQDELIAATKSPDEVRDHIDADSLGYLSIKGLVRAIGLKRDKFCLACFDGKYPIDVPQCMKVSKFALETGQGKRIQEDGSGVLDRRKLDRGRWVEKERV